VDTVTNWGSAGGGMAIILYVVVAAGVAGTHSFLCRGQSCLNKYVENKEAVALKKRFTF
jgi:hypothetical protein